jgi:hypothetical protein
MQRSQFQNGGQCPPYGVPFFTPIGRDKSRPLYYNVARRFSIAPEEMELLAPLSLKLVT